MLPASHRIESLDVLRGIAVVIMVLGHSVDSVLGPAFRSTELFRLYDAVRGFTAPLFLFISGLAFMVVTERRWAEHRTLGPFLARRLGRILALLTVGYALHLPFFSFEKVVAGSAPSDYARLFQVDVLQCIALTLLALQIIVFVSRTPSIAAGIAGVLGATIAAAAPVVWSADMSGGLPLFLTPYLNAHQPTVFPVVPYAAFMFAGVAFGRLYLWGREQGDEAQLLGRVLAVSAAGAALGILGAVIPERIYPDHDIWKANPGIVLVRIFAVVALVSSFLRAGSLPQVLHRPLCVLGRASFLVYTMHIVLVYGSPANDGLMQLVGQRLDAPAALAVATAVVLAMTAIVHLHAYLGARHAGRLAIARLYLATAVAYVFLTRPY
jgi:acyltransferase